MPRKSKHSVSLQIRITLTIKAGKSFFNFCRWLVKVLF